MLSPVSHAATRAATFPYTEQQPSAPRPHINPTKSDSIHFGSGQADIQAELERLKAENEPKNPLEKRFALKETLLKIRAEYNVTRNPDSLNALLPYRALLTRQGKDNKDLKAYDQLVKKILAQAEFYEIPSPDQLKAKLREAYRPKLPESETGRFLLKLLLVPIKFIAIPIHIARTWLDQTGMARMMNKLGKKMTPKGKKMPPEKIKAAFDTHARPLQEPATRYMAAAGIAQLLFKNPQYADQILEQSAQGKPLRFMIDTRKPLLVAGQAFPGLNVIHLNGPAMWKSIQKRKHVSQHEFVHLLSENNGMNKLGFMTDTQTRDFKTARKALKKQFRTQDKHWLGGLRCILPFKSCQNNSTGIRSYGFINNMEFLTVTLDTFMQQPHQLCTTPEGKKLYDIYKAVFNLDPLNEIAKPQ